jgi:hypothetical protein
MRVFSYLRKMLVPVFNKESAARELVRLCKELDEARKHCKDNNFSWRIAQLETMAEELYADYLATYELPEIALSAEYNSLFADVSVNYTNATGVLLSFAFSTAAGMDGAHYENMTLSEDFKIKLHQLSRAILSLLHEYREEAEQELE